MLHGARLGFGGPAEGASKICGAWKHLHHQGSWEAGDCQQTRSRNRHGCAQELWTHLHKGLATFPKGPVCVFIWIVATSQDTWRECFQPWLQASKNETCWASQVAQWWRIWLQCRRCQFDPWVGKIPWRRKWLLIPVFLPGKFHGQRSLEGYSPWGCKESDMTEHTCWITRRTKDQVSFSPQNRFSLTALHHLSLSSLELFLTEVAVNCGSVTYLLWLMWPLQESWERSIHFIIKSFSF